MNLLLINSNNESSFVASYMNGSVHAKYTTDFLDTYEKIAFLKSPDKLVHCLKYVTEEIQAEGVHMKEIDAIAVTTGPGSFTGIRVGIALAKGIADALSKKIIPIDNFELISKQSEGLIQSEKYCVLVQAKLPEFYYALYENKVQIDKGCIRFDDLISKFNKNTTIVANFSNEYEKNLVYFNFLNVRNSISELDAMISLSGEKYLSNTLFESNKVEPLYLKDFTFRKYI